MGGSSKFYRDTARDITQPKLSNPLYLPLPHPTGDEEWRVPSTLKEMRKNPAPGS